MNGCWLLPCIENLCPSYLVVLMVLFLTMLRIRSWVLINYGKFNIQSLSCWSPGFGCKLEVNDGVDQFDFIPRRKLVELSSSSSSSDDSILFQELKLANCGQFKTQLLKRVLNILQKSQSNAKISAFFGLHEWAMLYQGKDIHHSQYNF